jgi:sulfotransferase
MKTLFFLSGLPRSGSTLLGSLLNQHPEIYATPTSPLADLLCLLDTNFNHLDLQYTYEKEKILYNTYHSVMNNFYNHVPKKYIFDKHRGWPKNVDSIKKFYNNSPKILATYRSIPEVLSSFITLIEKTNQYDNFVDNKLRENNIEINNSNRAEYLWRFYVSDPYQSLIYGLKNFREHIHLINYNDLIQTPEKEMEKIYEFLEIESYSHNFLSIVNTCGEDKDSAWGLDGLHNIRTKLEKTSKPPEEVIGKENVKLYNLFNI